MPGPSFVTATAPLNRAKSEYSSVVLLRGHPQGNYLPKRRCRFFLVVIIEPVGVREHGGVISGSIDDVSEKVALLVVWPLFGLQPFKKTRGTLFVPRGLNPWRVYTGLMA